MIKKYRKKPVEVDAILLEPTVESASMIQSWIGKKLGSEWTGLGKLTCLVIPTLEGNMRAIPGDYIIRGVEGEFYPCKPDIFKKTYEEVEVDIDEPADLPFSDVDPGRLEEQRALDKS